MDPRSPFKLPLLPIQPPMLRRAGGKPIQRLTGPTAQCCNPVPVAIRAEPNWHVYPKGAKSLDPEPVNGRSLWFGPRTVLQFHPGGLFDAVNRRFASPFVAEC